MEEIAIKNQDDQSRASQGDRLLDWYFELADKVVQRIVVRYVFKVDEGKDIAKESTQSQTEFSMRRNILPCSRVALSRSKPKLSKTCVYAARGLPTDGSRNLSSDQRDQRLMQLVFARE